MDFSMGKQGGLGKQKFGDPFPFCVCWRGFLGFTVGNGLVGKNGIGGGIQEVGMQNAESKRRKEVMNFLQAWEKLGVENTWAGNFSQNGQRVGVLDGE
jgi:hypothetical protein